MPFQPDKVYQGKIIHVAKEEGYGFIVSSHPDIRWTRIYFKWHGLNQETLHFNDLENNMDVDFEVKDHPKGIRAIKIDIVYPDESRTKRGKEVKISGSITIEE